MTISARVAANRANAQRSTGPKTIVGKSRAAQNALRHGLAVPVSADPALARQIEDLAQAIAKPDASIVRLEAARRIAEAQIDLLRVRSARLALLNDQMSRAKRPSPRYLIYSFKQLSKRDNFDFDLDERTNAVVRALKAINEDGEPLSLAEGFGALAVSLARLDRYELRALSRRKAAVRAFDALI